MEFYTPIFRYQIGDPTTTADSVICTMESGAMGLDYHTLGALRLWGGQLYQHQPDHTGGQDLGDLAKAWLYYGQLLDVRSGGGWAGVKNALGQHRSVILQGDEAGGTTTIDNCQAGFRGGHAVVLIPRVASWAATGDPLCKEFKVIPEANVRAFAEALNPRVQFAVTAPHGILVPAPREVNVKITAAVEQKWTATANGVLRANPRRLDPLLAHPPTGTIVTSYMEIEEHTAAGTNYWRAIRWPLNATTGTRGVAFLLHRGPGVAAGHDWTPGAILAP